MSSLNTIQVFEHQFLKIEGKFEQKHFIALSKLNALHNDCYFDLRHNGIKFKQYVGVIQVDGLTIEILPKIDSTSDDKSLWHDVLIDMLRVTKKLKVQKAGEANVKKQQIHLLDIYFEWFLSEVQLLIHQGLIKQYYKETGNVKALKGKLEFSGHIRQNLVHKERFYTTHQIYDKDHLVHQILAQALDIVAQFSRGNYLYSKCKSVQLDFPEVKAIQANATTFSKVPASRKTASYATALEIARLIILNYAPNVSSGSERMLALLFDMNSLWEEYVLVRLKQVQDDYKLIVLGQLSKTFWNGITVRPDIVIEKVEGEKKEVFVIDTKWKNINNINPSTHDLRQMYVYNEYWNAKKSMLLYPNNTSKLETDFKKFDDLDRHRIIGSENEHHKCGLGKISIFHLDEKNLNEKNLNEKNLNEKIGENILEWFGLKKSK
jgi:5-methylcytosine-specific restriction enzyme subunit McrC